MTAQSIETVATEAAFPAHGAEITVPLNRLKASPRNARKTPHSPATIEAFAASIKAKGVLQPPVVEIERDGEGIPTGNYLVTIGEGRRQGLRLLAKRKAIKRTHPVRVIVDAENDAHEISLDENMTREAMHPADQFEAFQRLAVEKGYGPEEIGARFGVSAHVVRQRLRLASVAPELIEAYRAGGLTMDQLMGFAVSKDHERQRQVFYRIAQNTPGYAVRRYMTEAKVELDERRARFVGVEAYEAAGGVVLRDLFIEDGAGWLEDIGLLDRLAQDKLDGLAEEAREREGWKWAAGHFDFPYGETYSRVYAEAVERSEAAATAIAALSEEYDQLVVEIEDAEEPSPERDARLEEIDAALQAYGPDFAYAAYDLARSGVIVTLGYDGLARFERGLVRPEDVVVEPQDEASGEQPGADDDAGGDEAVRGEEPRSEEPEADEGLVPLSERLVIDLTAHRTAGLRDALAQDATLTLTVVVHAMALQALYPGHAVSSPLQLRLGFMGLERLAPGVDDSPAMRRINARGSAWIKRLPSRADDLWSALVEMPGSDLLDLMAHCASAAVNAVCDPHDRRPSAWAQAEVLATAVGLDMTTTWTATAASYFSRVAKARMLEAVEEAVGKPDAERIAGFKKADMADAAELLVSGKGWLPPLLRTVPAIPPEAERSEEAGTVGEGTAPASDEDYAFAAE
ncbi:ParB/RepB/Spo0J family partition protein [Brevundimonas diminuta]|uniref:ParB/RepB/Spo0J family partition protein n=1 Tax=Brevundimonas diminuta TaxID=293 RepID=UPI000207E892|nr:ParB/RepB/Spo0J family partition protein [Brevundimonas diminuta]EGF94121.1 parB-like nuclease domain protein [Brevundimonas diminuta ATCC 11568]OWR20274.1 chromosome partitioning protein ParB [Brevundimonas diminuta]WQE43928.1 ParB N-terminal domain-containing protein [Brevundimonas diminuta]SUW16419.1 plasmid partitioning protein [Brevundimonas diminuta]